MRGSAVFRTGVAPGGALAGPWVRDPLWTRARAVPSLDLRFAANKSLVDATTGASLVTFTRASSATYTDSAGVLRSSVTNLLLRSEEFDNVYWNLKSNVAIIANNTTSPVGTNTADKLNETAFLAAHYAGINNITVPANSTVTLSVYAKAAERGFVGLQVTPDGTNYIYCTFNLSTGVASTPATAGNATGVSASITSAGDGWYRCSVSGIPSTTVANAIPAIYVGSTNSNFVLNGYTGVAGSGIYLWGAQLEQSSTVGEYIPTTGTINSAPRFDHNPTTGESLGLLVEEARTNSVTNNTMVGAVAGTPGTNPTGWIYATASSNGLTISIAGTGVENGINYIDYRFNGTTVASPNGCAIGFVNASAVTGQTWTASTYWKLAAGSTTGVNSWQIGIIEGTAGGSFITGAFYTQTAPTSAALISQRPTATRTLSGGATVGLVTYPISINVAGNTAIDFTLRIGLPQLEQGAFATSVIPTTSATVTRAADVASITGSNFSSFYNQTEGTVFADAKEYPFASTLSRSFYGFDSSATPNADFNRQWIWNGNTALLNNSVYTSSSGPTAAEFSNTIINEQKRTALAYKVNDYARSYNGGAVVTDLSGNLPVGIDRLGIGSSNNSQHLSGTIKRLTYWPVRLANTVLQQITQP